MTVSRRCVVVGIGTAMALPAMAQAPNPWVGTWKGQIGGSFPGKDGSERTMVIQSVSADGKVTGGWGATKAPKIGNADFSLAGDKLMVTTSADTQVELARAGDRKARGVFRAMKSGKTYPLEMERQ